MTSAPHFVFVPGGGENGAGETTRARILADALRERLPACRLGFLTGERHPGLARDGFEQHTVPGRVSRSVGR